MNLKENKKAMQLLQLAVLYIFCMALLLSFPSKGAEIHTRSDSVINPSEIRVISDTTDNATTLTKKAKSIIHSSAGNDDVAYAGNDNDVLFPNKSLSLSSSHFTWGAEVGSSIDMTSNDMTTFDLDVLLGYKNNYIRTVGIGAGIHRSFGSKNTFIPVYVLFRSSFRKKPSLLFLHFKAGYSFNTINNGDSMGDISASLGCGINLAMSKKFQSHIIIGYGFRHFNKSHRSKINLNTSNVSLAQISFGVNF